MIKFCRLLIRRRFSLPETIEPPLRYLRAAVAKVNPVTEGVFYPRGLYSSDDVLLKQVDDLSETANQNKQDTDLQFLLGYQYLGLGELDKAAEPLKNASFDSLNGPPANALLQLLDKLQASTGRGRNQNWHVKAKFTLDLIKKET